MAWYLPPVECLSKVSSADILYDKRDGLTEQIQLWLKAMMQIMQTCIWTDIYVMGGDESDFRSWTINTMLGLEEEKKRDSNYFVTAAASCQLSK